VGTFYGTNINFGLDHHSSQGQGDVFVLQLSVSDGHTVSSWSFGDSDHDEGTSFGYDTAGHLVFAGNFNGTINIDGELQAGVGFPDIFIAKRAPNGQDLWSQSLGGDNDESVKALALDTNDYSVLAGEFMQDLAADNINITANGGDAFIAILDDSGAGQWGWSLGGGSADLANDVVADPQSNIAVVGQCATGLTIGSVTHACAAKDGFVIKYDSQRNPVWGRVVGGPAEDELTGVAIGRPPDYRVVVVGSFNELMGVDNGVALQSAGAYDVFVGVLRP